MTPRVSPLAWVFIAPIRLYQVGISRYTPPTCRYYPCCSSYGIGALKRHGAVKGLILTAWRLLRCNPWSDGGVDKVPDRGRWRWEDPDDLRSRTERGAVINIYDEGLGLAAESDFAATDSGAARTAGRTAA